MKLEKAERIFEEAVDIDRVNALVQEGRFAARDVALEEARIRCGIDHETALSFVMAELEYRLENGECDARDIASADDPDAALVELLLDCGESALGRFLVRQALLGNVASFHL